MKTLKKAIIILFITIFFASMGIIGVGCKESATAAEESATAAEESIDEGFAINVWVIAGNMGNVFTKAKEVFERDNPNIKVNLNLFDLQSSLEAVAPSALVSGKEDLNFIVTAADANGFSLIEKGLFKDLTPYIEKYGWFDQQMPGIQDAFRAKDGKYYFIGSHWDSIPVIWYNSKIFKEVGVEIPKNMDDLFTLCEKIKAAGYNPISLGNLEKLMGRFFFYTMEQRIMNEDTFKSMLNWVNLSKDEQIELAEVYTKELIDVYKYLRKMGEAGIFGDVPATGSLGNMEAQDEYALSKSAMYISGTWLAGSLPITYPDFEKNLACFLVPELNGKKEAVSWFSWGMAIPAYVNDGKEMDILMDFMDTIISNEVTLQYVREGMNPVSTNITSQERKENGIEVHANIIEDMNEAGTFSPFEVKYFPNEVDMLAGWDLSSEVIDGATSPEDAAQLVYDKMIDVINE